ncbi:MAG: alpha/beta hydrolase [Patescibacteria group bacterium]
MIISITRVLLKIIKILLKIVFWLFVFAVLALIFFSWHAGRREINDRHTSAPASGQFVRAGDIEMYVQEVGSKDAIPVVFIHGTGAWSESWRDSLQALGDAGFRAVALDIPPFGYSERPREARYARKDQASRIIGALDSLGIKKAVFVGHSFGGGATVEAVLQAPDRVAGLVLVDVALGLGSSPSSSSDVLGMVLGVSPLGYTITAATLTNPMTTKYILRSFIKDPADATPERVIVYQKPLSLNGTTAAVSAWLRQFFVHDTQALSSSIDSYRSITVPTAIMWGSDDTVTPLEQGEYIQKNIPNAELVVLKGIGHIPQIEDPKLFETALLAFLQKYNFHVSTEGR